MDNKEMAAFMKAFDVLDDLNQHGTADKIWSLNKEAFMSLVATIVDGYGAKNNMPSEDTLEMMDLLVSTMRKVHSKRGAWEE